MSFYGLLLMKKGYQYNNEIILYYQIVLKNS